MPFLWTSFSPKTEIQYQKNSPFLTEVQTDNHSSAPVVGEISP